MPRRIARAHYVRACLVSALLWTAACTQQAAHVELKGNDIYSRNGVNYASNSGGYTNPYGSGYQSGSAYSQAASVYSASSYSSPVHVPQGTEQNAAVQSIGVSDLAPPSPSSSYSSQEVPVSQVTPPPVQEPAYHADSTTQTLNWVTTADASNTATHEEAFNLRPQSKSLDTGAMREQMVSEVKAPAPASTALAPSPAKPVILTHGPETKPVTLSRGADFMWPVGSKKVISGFGPKGGGKVNDGINIASAEGEPVWAAADGEIVYIGNEMKGYGNMVLIKHADGKATSYSHLSRATVDKYDRVKQGDIIGYIGTSGNVKEPQLHFAVREGSEPVDPQKYLSSSVAGL